jgi:hypothetical protein
MAPNAPAVVGCKDTTMLQVAFGSSEAPLQPSVPFTNSAASPIATVSLPEAVLPVFVTVKLCGVPVPPMTTEPRLAVPVTVREVGPTETQDRAAVTVAAAPLLSATDRLAVFVPTLVGLHATLSEQPVVPARGARQPGSLIKNWSALAPVMVAWIVPVDRPPTFATPKGTSALWTPFWVWKSPLGGVIANLAVSTTVAVTTAVLLRPAALHVTESLFAPEVVALKVKPTVHVLGAA